ncbi:MAG: NAD(P)-dependent oxidoreductase [Armatimonadetes bacterium]|nr:NAD(P)-dependent oxidoreductase [Armatimonadota bacterium]
MKVLVLGAAGPVAAAAIEAMKPYHALTLTDIKPMESEHPTRIVDIADPAQVAVAAEGHDAIINFTVNRYDPSASFHVNLLGAYAVMEAAVACGIRKVVHTGPFMLMGETYAHDYDLTDDCPARPGTGLYCLTKYLGQEVCRIYAEAHDLVVPCLLYSGFFDPQESHRGGFPLYVSWRDSGEAARLAVEVPGLPRPFEVLHILADLPYRKFINEKARRLLGWEPKDTFERIWKI